MAELTFAEISKLLKYDPETGKLFWLPRPVEMFHGGGKTSQAHIARTWNTRFADKEAFKADLHGYLSGRIFRTLYRAHRIGWLLHYGEWPTHQIDHINGDRSDNRMINLRDVAASDNRKNQRLRSDNSSGTFGVDWDKNRQKWSARIGHKYLGRFESKDDAIAARARAEVEFGYHPNHGRT